MTVFAADIDKALIVQENEVGARYVFRYFSCGVMGFQQFVTKLPSDWTIHTFTCWQGMPSVLIEIN